MLGVLPSSTLNEGKRDNGRHDSPSRGAKQQAQEQVIQAAMDELFDPVTGKRKELM